MKKHKNDRRIPGGKIDTCRLCLKTTQLRLSHIAPKWVYLWGKQEGKGTIVGNYPSINEVRTEQDGTKNYLLCDSCEHILGKAEAYAKVLMHGTKQEHLENKITSIGFVYKDLDLELIQKFILGLALKSHFSQSAPFHNINIEDYQIDGIRQRILNPTVEDVDFTIISMRLVSRQIDGIDTRAMIFPFEGVYQKTLYLSFIIAGWEWFIFFNQKKLLSDEALIFLSQKKDGSMIIQDLDIVDHRKFSYLKNGQ